MDAVARVSVLGLGAGVGWDGVARGLRDEGGVSGWDLERVAMTVGLLLVAGPVGKRVEGRADLWAAHMCFGVGAFPGIVGSMDTPVRSLGLFFGLCSSDWGVGGIFWGNALSRGRAHGKEPGPRVGRLVCRAVVDLLWSGVR
jgi:hypothetical protein